jgi:hypothetical protein
LNLIRAPAEAAVLACSGCDGYFANPGNSPGVGQRVRAILAEQARIAGLVRDLGRRLEEALAEASGNAPPWPRCWRSAGTSWRTRAAARVLPDPGLVAVPNVAVHGAQVLR